MTKKALKDIAFKEIDKHRDKIISIANSILHEPEEGFKEKKTAEKVKEAFEEFGIKYRSDLAITGIKGVSKVGSHVSKEGEVPRVQFGRLKGSIDHEVHPLLPIGRVGTNLPYGKFLELGTRKMGPRPFLLPAVHISEPAIRELFGIGMKNSMRGF